MIRNYENAIKCLNQLQTNFSTIQEIRHQWTKGKPPREPDLIPQMIEWIRRIGYSPNDFDSMNPIHVTGTKGKGSVCAFLQSILLQYVGDVGLYTSPHLKSVTERIRINGQPLSEEKFAKYFFDIYERLENTSSDLDKFPRHVPGAKPMYFRYLTLMSFHAFMQENIKHAIYEVGIGGEYDSTNIFVSPRACAVSSLGIDHTAVLGNTIGEIAWNKAGIFKRGVPAYTIDDQPAEAVQVLRERAIEKQVSKFEIVPIHGDIAGKTLGLRGKFQEKNATLACYLAGEALGIEISHHKSLPEKFINGLETATWPGRCQVMQTSPTTKWFMDGAHTTESLEAATEWFASVVDKSQPISLVFNQQKRDNVADLLTNFYGNMKSHGIKVAKAYFTTNQSFESGFLADMVSHNVSAEEVNLLTIQNQLANVWSKLDPDTEIHVCSSLEQVVAKADGQIFATGSLLMLGGLLAVID